MQNTKKKNDEIKDFNELYGFNDLNEHTCKEFYGTFKTPYREKLYFNMYLEDNEQTNDDTLKLCKIGGEKSLISAPTGSGKTHLMINEIFPILQKETKEDEICLNLFFVPTRSQSEQIANEYDGISSIVGDETNYREIDTECSGNYVAVYDKVNDILTSVKQMLEKDKRLNIHMFVDECHTLTLADFRCQTIIKLFELEKLVLKEKGSVLHITATPMAMAWCQYNNLLFFEKCNTKPSFKKLKLFVNNDERPTNDFIKDVIIPYGKGIVRVNSKSKQDTLCKDLQGMGYKTYAVNGEDKSFDVDEFGRIIYKNALLNSIINESLIVNSHYTFCTSMLDEGQNIKGIGSIQNQDSKYCGFFCILNILDLNLIAAQQFANRLRYPVNSYNIIYCNKDIYNKNRNNQVKKNFKNLKQMVNNVGYYFKKDLNRYQKIAAFEIQDLKDTDRYDKEVFEKERNHNLNFQDLKTNRSNSYGGSITYQNEEYVVAYNFLFNYIYMQYMHQLYFHLEELIQQIEELFHIDVEIVNNVNPYVCPDNQAYEIEKNTLLSLVGNDDFIQHYYKKEYENVRNGTLFKDVEFLHRTDIPIPDAIELRCSTLNNLQFNIIKNNCTYDFIQKKFEWKDYELLESVLNEEVLFKDLKSSEYKDHIGTVLANEPYVQRIKQMLRIGIPIRTALSVKPNQINQYMKQFQIVENNKSFLKNETNINISGSQTQYLILSYVINDLNFSLTKINRIKMTDERIDELLAIINKHQKINCTKTQLIKLLKMIFETSNVSYNKQKYLELRSIKLTLK